MVNIWLQFTLCFNSYLLVSFSLCLCFSFFLLRFVLFLQQCLYHLLHTLSFHSRFLLFHHIFLQIFNLLHHHFSFLGSKYWIFKNISCILRLVHRYFLYRLHVCRISKWHKTLPIKCLKRFSLCALSGSVFWLLGCPFVLNSNANTYRKTYMIPIIVRKLFHHF